MNKLEKQYFEALYQDRVESANMLEKPSMRGIKNSVVEKYSDQAHFVYELLQNADDAGATSARFILEKERLIFTHNGNRHFSVSDPGNEDNDSKTGCIGDVNAITAIANSNKTAASIGKFGVGFKAVFQYTTTPHIYDPNFCFKIERFIVPVMLEHDFPGRVTNETLFVFPFDHPDRSPQIAAEDIADKLKNLVFPTLFLSNLKNVDFCYDNVVGRYTKTIDRRIQFEDISAELVSLISDKGLGVSRKKLWLFSRADQNGYRYSVGFFINDIGRLTPENYSAFCFFPTKENTGLHFILHAPFLLTDSREGIRSGVPYNHHMVDCLSALAADALFCMKEIGIQDSVQMIDDNIVDIIPIDVKEFSDPTDKSKISFQPFYHAIRKKFESEELLPSYDGYVSKEHAYWAAVPRLAKLFSNEQLHMICEDPEAKWVFASLGREEISKRSNKALFNYINSLTRTHLNEDVILEGRKKSHWYSNDGEKNDSVLIKGITSDFIERQSFDWLHTFYQWLSETEHRTFIAGYDPFFLDQNGKAVSPVDEEGNETLFLPVGDDEGYHVVNPLLLQNPNTCKFMKEIGIKEPSLKDKIYNQICSLYENNRVPHNVDQHGKIFFQYYCQCPNEETEEFIDLIRDLKFLPVYKKGNHGQYYHIAKYLYFPAADLKEFLQYKKDVSFLDLEYFKSTLDVNKEEQLFNFLTSLGVKRTLTVITKYIDLNVNSVCHQVWNSITSVRRLYGDYSGVELPCTTHPNTDKLEETTIEGCEELLKHIIRNHDVQKSILLWNSLQKVIEKECRGWSSTRLSSLLICKYHYFYYKARIQTFDSKDAIILKTGRWLVDTQGNFVAPNEITTDKLSKNYDVSSGYGKELLEFLNIQNPPVEVKKEQKTEDNSNLTEVQKVLCDLGKTLQENGITKDDVLEYLEFKREKERQKSANDNKEQVENEAADSNRIGVDVDSNQSMGGQDPLSDDYDLPEPALETADQLNKTAKKIVRDITRQMQTTFVQSDNHEPEIQDHYDEDENIPAPVDYEDKIEKAKYSSATEISHIAHLQELQNKAVRSTKYSFAWFVALLEMEMNNKSEVDNYKRRISIQFDEVEREPGTSRTLILKHPNRHIPSEMEELPDVPLVLHIGEQNKTLVMEAANIRSFILRAKIKSSADIENIDFSSVTSATIDIKSPAFLLDELRGQFLEMGYEDDFDMKKNLCSNIEFIFGPPGTGKTTYLARNVILPLMAQERCKILVLTPTNQSADVLVHKIMEVSGGNQSYSDWLIRFGGTQDESIEDNQILKDKTFDITKLQKCVTVTTIHRFPYDFFMPQGKRVFINGINWDYIIIDEASMIHLSNIIYPLYKKTPKKFIIAGDPFQIEPIASINLWKDENIYSMVELNSFKNPMTVPHKYKVILLTTQYRSVPDIGSIFSKFAYDGILTHGRMSRERKKLHFGNGLEMKTLNIIKFPVSKYESIYKPKRLAASTYQIYSALLTFEYVNYIARLIAEAKPDDVWSIGIISPYKAQADMIDKLLSSIHVSDKVEIRAGTIHTFQGDECDIMFIVLNPPPTISASPKIFLNKKNIINVAVSRAANYMFFIMPDNDTANIQDLYQVKRVENLIKETKSWAEFGSHDIEDKIFNDPYYLENNTFSTSHQSVNIYRLPEKRYEVRTENNAVDIQVLDKILNKTNPVHHSGETSEKESTKPIPGNIAERTKPSKENRREGTNKRGKNFNRKKNQNKVITMNITATIHGTAPAKYRMTTYTGVLQQASHIKLTSMQLFIFSRGRTFKIPVYVVKDKNTVYIEDKGFQALKKEITAPNTTFEIR